MLRINRLLRAAKNVSKVPHRGGPGWDRPDVPPTQRVETDTRWTHLEIVYTFFDSSMPEFYLTEPEIYEGDLVQALPQFFSVWGFLFGSAIAFSLFYELVNPTRTQEPFDPVNANNFLTQMKRLNEQKLGLKYAKENPFGITISSELFPYNSDGVYYYPKKYYRLKSSVEHLETINKQAAEYLKAAMQRASTPKQSAHSEQAHH